MIREQRFVYAMLYSFSSLGKIMVRLIVLVLLLLYPLISVIADIQDSNWLTEKYFELNIDTLLFDKTPEPINTTITYSRGQMLYENHCRVCHTGIVHERKDHKAKSRDDIRYWVRLWSGELKLKWSEDEIEDVIQFVDHTYYQF